MSPFDMNRSEPDNQPETVSTPPANDGEPRHAPATRTGDGPLVSEPSTSHGRISRFLLNVYGAEPTCVDGPERHWFHSMAGLMIAVAALSCVSMSALLLNRWPEAPQAAVAGGIFWGACIFLLERSYTSFVERYPTWWRKVIPALARVAVAVFAAIIIAESLVMLFFSHEIDQQLERLNVFNRGMLTEQVDETIDKGQQEFVKKRERLESAVANDKDKLTVMSTLYTCETNSALALDEQCRQLAVEHGIRFSEQGGTGGETDSAILRYVADAEAELEGSRRELTTYIKPSNQALSDEDRAVCSMGISDSLSQWDVDMCRAKVDVLNSLTADESTYQHTILNRILALGFIGEPMEDEANISELERTIMAQQKDYASTWHRVIFWTLLAFDLSPVLFKLIRGSTKHDENVRNALPAVDFSRAEAHEYAEDLDIRRPFELERKLTPWYKSRSTLRDQLLTSATGASKTYWDNQFKAQQSTAGNARELHPPTPLPRAASPRPQSGEARPRHTTTSGPLKGAASPAESRRVTAPAPKGNVYGTGGIAKSIPEITSGGLLRGERFSGKQTVVTIAHEIPTESLVFQIREVKIGGNQAANLGERSRAVAKIVKPNLHPEDTIWGRQSLEKENAIALSLAEIESSLDTLTRRVEYDKDLGVHFRLMPLLPAGDLSRLINYREGHWLEPLPQGGQATLADAFDLMEGVLTCLGEAHARDIFHCDIKPGNILLRVNHDTNRRDLPAYSPVLSDWGDAKLLSDSGWGVTDGRRRSNEWAAPELLNMAGIASLPERRNPNEDPRTAYVDVFSVGATMYELIDGLNPRARDAKNKGLNIREPVHFKTCVDATLHTIPHNPAIPDDLFDLLSRWQALKPHTRQPEREGRSVGHWACEDLKSVRRSLPQAVLDTALEEYRAG
mgnify:CR=1 FL=1